MSHQDINAQWYEVPFVQACLPSLQIECPATKLWLPVNAKNQQSDIHGKCNP